MINSPVFVLNENGDEVVDKLILPVESYNEYDYKVQYVGLFYIYDN